MPKTTQTPSTRPTKAVKTAPSSRRPPPPPRPIRPPITSLVEFERRHHEVDDQVTRLLERPRYRELHLDVAGELGVRSALHLHANNAQARIAVATIMDREVRRYAIATPQTFFFVTLARRDHVTTLADGRAFDIRKVTGWGYQVLAGLDFVGMVEAGFHSTLGKLEFGFPKGLSWHLHALVWGCLPEEIATRIAKVNARFDAAVPGLNAANVRSLTPEEAPGRATYMCKGQVKEYRAWRRTQSSVDPSTGEVFDTPTRESSLKARDIRPGDALRVMDAFVARTIDRLAFAGGDGRALLASVRKESRKPARDIEERKQTWHFAQLAGAHHRRRGRRRPS